MFPIDCMINPIGYRLSVLHAYMPSATAKDRRERLVLCTGATVTKLEFNEQGSEVTGVRLTDSESKSTNTRERSVKAKREVIVCCGALFSPQVLMSR